uniref:MAGUK p55 scaffold protein 7b n=1 Tax=Esox lucius TaxID=8010 RepID=A0A3P8YLI3_ESOLU
MDGCSHPLLPTNRMGRVPAKFLYVRSFSTFSVQGLLSVHDTVARKGYDPELPPLPDDTVGEDSVRIVSLMKSQEPLGATLKRDGSSGAVIVARVMKGGAADATGLIHEGDELREVNGVPVENRNPEEIPPILAQSQGVVTFTVIPAAVSTEELSANESELFVRTLFDYDPEQDPAIPCRQAGLRFKRGDILQIVSHRDDTWWQARHYGDRNPRAGVCKSERCVTGISFTTAGLRRSFRLGRRGSGSGSVEENPPESRWRRKEIGGACQAPTYLEVCWPEGVGLSELKRRLLISDPDHFGVPVPHTTREKRNREEEGVEYHFVSRQTFELNIVNHRFIEYGHHRGNYYGTSLDSVRKVTAEGKVCLLDVQPNTIHRLHTAEFKPYVLFVKPPSIGELRFSRRKAKFFATKETKPTKTFREEDFEDMIGSAEAMDSQYGHLFERVLVNGDIVSAFNELRAELRRLETEQPQWIPVEWAGRAVQNTETLC